MRRRHFLRTGLLLLGASGARGRAWARQPGKQEARPMPRKHPNLLFVFGDQMRVMDMGCAGNPDVQTPTMDRLAREGTRFSRAYANCPVCPPSRASLLTGLYPMTCRTVANDLPLPTEFAGIGETLRRAGYRTGYIGKWHLDGVPRSRFTPPGERRHGFEYWAVWNCAHNYFAGKYYLDTDEPIPIEGYEPAGQTDLALGFLEEAAAGDKPFALFLSWGPPHNPYRQVPEHYRQMYDPEAITLRPNFRELPPDYPTLGPETDPRRALADYYAHITALDEQLGRLLDALERLGQADDTIVVFTSDHGDMLWSQGRLRKQQPWEESISIPFLVRWPGQVPAGREVTGLLSVVDMAPSLLSLMGVEAREPMEGADLAGVFLGDEGPMPESVFLMDVVTMDEAHAQGLREWRGVRTQRYTYARFADGEPWVLYDNEADPYQLNNLATDPGAEGLRRELEEQLQQWLKLTKDECLPWQEVIRRLGLVELWNAREQELHPHDPRLL
ncbi:MAG: sulfatase [Armatimonadetes bacterium]|nr:sulfatase [Armatimonadota bacterium]